MQTIELSQLKPIASGLEKVVFWHPHQPGQLIKIVTPAHIKLMRQQWPLLTRMQRVSHYFFYINEIVEHMAIRAHPAPGIHQLQTITGLVDTDLGLGLVVEAITREDGQLAHTLDQLIALDRFGETEKQALQTFCQWLADSPLIVRSLSLPNIVWHEKDQHFVLIDGFGNQAPRFSLRSLFKGYNQRHNKRKIKRLLKHVEAKLEGRTVKSKAAARHARRLQKLADFEKQE